MKGTLITRVSLVVISLSLILSFSLCSTGGGGEGEVITWVVAWFSGEDLGGTAGTDDDIFFSRSTDSGTTWSAVQTLNTNADTDSQVDYRPNLITDGNGNWIAVWNSAENLEGVVGTDWDIFFSRSTDEGVTWSAVQTLNTNADTDTGLDYDTVLATDGNGNCVAAWSSNEDLNGTAGTDYDIFFARSTDNGATWSEVQTLNSSATADTGDDWYPDIVTDGSGNWVAVWQSMEDLGGTAGTDVDIFVSRSNDNGVTWSAVQTLNTNGNTDSGNDVQCIITAGNGYWVAVWQSNEDLGGTSGTDDDIFISRSNDNGATWTAVQTLNSNAASDTGVDNYPQVVTDANGNWIAVWQSSMNLGGTAGTDYDIFVSCSNDNGAMWSTVQTLNPNANNDTGDDSHPYVMTDYNGNWIAVWESNENLGDTAGTDSDIFVSHSSDNGSTWSEVKTLNSNAATDAEDDLFF